MKDVILMSELKVVGTVAGTINSRMSGTNEIADEPMLFSSSIDFAFENGGPLTEMVLTKLLYGGYLNSKSETYPYVVIDTRAHMLMPGMYPAIPGWHCDFTPRGKNGQPIPEYASTKQNHFAVFLSSVPGLSCTQFIRNGTLMLEYDPEAVWGSINKFINSRYLSTHRNHPYLWSAREGEIVQFSGQTLHRAMPSIGHGWRFFVRVSFKAEEPLDQIRKQTQVYMLEERGW